jgi:anaerobic selenocysteine-containing dehydrogenase
MAEEKVHDGEQESEEVIWAPDGATKQAVQKDTKLDHRQWTWDEDGYTIIRGSARTGPGCHDNCGILMYVRDGQLVRIEGDPENPYNQGRLCPRCLAAKEMIYHPDRLLYPLKRSREDRGKNTFERISWDEAYSVINTEMKKVIDKYGAKAIHVTQGTGRDINGYGPLMAQLFGTPNYGMGFLSGEGCYAPRAFSTGLKVGGLFVCDYSQFMLDRYDDPRWERPEYVLIWGNNPVVANSDGTLGHWIVECMKRGSKLIVIDPKLTWLAGRADVWLQVRPGTDAALALALSNIIIENDLYDKEFIDLWTYGYEQFAEHVKPYTAEEAATICGVDAELITEAAMKIGAAESTCLQWGVAMDHTSEGFITGMACFDLMAVTGNFEKPGTMLAARSCFGVGATWMPDPFAWKDLPSLVEDENEIMNSQYPALRAMHAISQDMMLEALETGEPYPIKAVWLQTNNTLSCMGAQPQRILPALQNTDFNVCVDMFLTPTILAAADIVLPACSFSERNGLTGHQPYALSAVVQAIDTLGETKSDQQIIWEMGERFTGETMPFSTEEEFYDFVLKETEFKFDDMRKRTWAYPDFEYNKHEKGLLRPDGQPGFATSTGRYNFFSPEMQMFGLPPLADYEEPPESPVSTPETAEEYPLVLTTGGRLWGFFHSEHRQSPSMRRLHPNPLARIHPNTAEKYGIEHGKTMTIENRFGSCQMIAEVTPIIREDTIATDHGWWFPERDPDDGTMFGMMESNINQLLPMKPGKSGLGNSYKSQLCKVSRTAK